MKRWMWVAPGLLLCALLAIGGVLEGAPVDTGMMATAAMGSIAIWAVALRPHWRNIGFVLAYAVWSTPAPWLGGALGAALLGIALAEREGFLPVRRGA